MPMDKLYCAVVVLVVSLLNACAATKSANNIEYLPFEDRLQSHREKPCCVAGAQLRQSVLSAVNRVTMEENANLVSIYGIQSAYALFPLPDAPGTYSYQLSSYMLDQQSVFVPQITVLDHKFAAVDRTTADSIKYVPQTLTTDEGRLQLYISVKVTKGGPLRYLLLHSMLKEGQAYTWDTRDFRRTHSAIVQGQLFTYTENSQFNNITLHASPTGVIDIEQVPIGQVEEYNHHLFDMLKR